MVRVALGVLALALLADTALAAAVWSPWWALAAALPLALAAGVLVHRGRRADPDEPVWPLGKALEITDPDRPETTRAALPLSVLPFGVLFIGGTGAGKTTGVLSLLGAIRRAGHGLAYLDGKGEIDAYRLSVAMGFAPDRFFSSELAHSHTLNLLCGEAEDVLEIATRIFLPPAGSTAYYHDQQRAVLSWMVPLLHASQAPYTARDLFAALASEDALHEAIWRAKQGEAEGYQITLAEAFARREPRDRQEVLGGLLNRMSVYVQGPVADRVNAVDPDIDIAAAAAGGQHLYFHLPYTGVARDIGVAVQEQFGIVARRRQQAGGGPLYPIIADDWGRFVHENYAAITARCRSAGLPQILSFQSIGQMREVAPEFLTVLDDNLATKVVMRVMGEDTAAWAARLLGGYERLGAGVSELGGRQGASLQAAYRPRVEARELRELEPGGAYLSTVIREGAATRNPLWRTRLPYPELERPPENIGWPRPEPEPAGPGPGGLGLWDRHMNGRRWAAVREAASRAPRTDPAPDTPAVEVLS